MFDSIDENVSQQWERIRNHNLSLKALITPPHTAQLSATSGTLQGVTVSLKDNIDTAGITTTAGADFWRTRVPSHDAVVVSRLKAAGATLFGKANMTELAWGVRSYSAVGGQCRNPWDVNRIAGGSSGGSGAAVAAGFSTVSLGTDTGGSVRLPAAFCGVVGLRPSYGRIPNRGVIPLSESHDTVGPLAYRVADIARVFNVIAGHDEQDPTSQDHPVPDVLSALQKGVRDLVIGIPKNHYFDYCGSEVVNAVMKAAYTLEEHGALLQDIDVPMVEDAQEMASRIMFSEVCALYRERLDKNPDSISSAIRDRMLHGLSYTGMDYAEAVHFRRRWIKVVQRIYSSVQLLLVPTTTQTAPLLDDGQTLLEITRQLARNTYAGSLAGIPSMSVPCGFDSSGLPIGMLLEAPWWHEDRLIQAGHAYQRVTSHHLSRPALS